MGNIVFPIAISVATQAALDLKAPLANPVFTSPIRTAGYTVATLPAGVAGDRAYVTDATAPLYNAALVGGGTVTVPVFKNATAWVSA